MKVPIMSLMKGFVRSEKVFYTSFDKKGHMDTFIRHDVKQLIRLLLRKLLNKKATMESQQQR